MTAVEGQQAVLECVTGLSAPPPTVFWERDGQKVTAGQQTTVKFGFTHGGGAEQRWVLVLLCLCDYVIYF